MPFMKKTLLLFLIVFQVNAQTFKPAVATAAEISQWEKQAKDVTIHRDKWGVPHVEGKTDADAVFGLIYAQCEDDFARVELNYVEKLGRLSEIEGDIKLYNDLQIKLLIDEKAARQDYAKAAPWMKKLLNAHAAGINYFLHKNPEVKPALLTRFEPWFPLLWTDGSIGAISTQDLRLSELYDFYSEEKNTGFFQERDEEVYQQTGSNGFAIAPQLSKSGNALLYINPHTTFYFRPEVHMVSKEGLNAYGAVTWGQFFIYQGFNETCGWMHTSSNADVADVYIEDIQKKGDKFYYKFDGKLKPVEVKEFEIKFKTDEGFSSKKFTTYFTQHGPIMAERDGKWLSLKHYNRAAKSLEQSWIRTKSDGFKGYEKAMDLKANTSNNTVFADKYGNIAYWHGNYMPKRNPEIEWHKAVDGSVKMNEYQGLHPVKEVVHVYNPANGWIQNCNSTPFTSAAEFSPKKTDYPAYMAPDGENFRGVNAVRLLSEVDKLDIESLIELGYNRYLPAFKVLAPRLIKALNSSQETDLTEVKTILSNWDYFVNEKSIAANLFIHWGEKLGPEIRKTYINPGEKDQVEATSTFAQIATDEQVLAPLREVLEELIKNYGTWKVTWGEINRFQRLNGKVYNEYDDNAPSYSMGNASALWGCLPSFNSRYRNGSIKRYGYSGNSFVCAVEFGEKIKAKSLLAGGNSGDENSPHFTDQAQMFVNGQFKDVLFYPEDFKKNAVKVYQPGE